MKKGKGEVVKEGIWEWVMGMKRNWELKKKIKRNVIESLKK